MAYRYFQNPNDSNKVYGYDPTTQKNLIDIAVTANWPEVTDSWPPAAPIINPLITSAAQALAKSDISIIRIVAAGVAVPADFLTYRAALRAIVNGTDTVSTLPIAPTDYPQGT